MNKKLSKLIVGAFALVLSAPNANAQTQLFTNGKEGSTPIYWRIPSIVRMNDGALWAFTDKRYYDTQDLGGKDGITPHQIEIYGRKSFDNGKSWGNAEVVLQSNLNASGANEYLYAFGDAATVVDRESGRILMMAASGQKGVKANLTGQPFVTRSVYDAGKWLTSNVSDQFYGPNNLYGKTLFVTSGRMVQSTIYKKDKFYNILSLLIGFSYIIAHSYYMWTPAFFNNGWADVNFVACLFFCPVIAFFLGKEKMRFKPLEYIGKASYHVYLTQMVYYNFVKREIMISILKSPFLWCGVSMLIIVSVGCLFYKAEMSLRKRFLDNKTAE